MLLDLGVLDLSSMSNKLIKIEFYVLSTPLVVIEHMHEMMEYVKNPKFVFSTLWDPKKEYK